MTQPKLFIALPCYGDAPALFCRGLTMLINDLPERHGISIFVKWCVGDSLVARARNTLTADFLETDCTHMLFLDTDLIVSAEQIARLLSHDEELVAGFYPKKQDGDLNWVCNALPENPPKDERGLQQVRYIGTGFMLMKRGLIQRMRDTGVAAEFRADSSGRIEHDFWPTGVYRAPGAQHGRYLSEDWWFCQRALDMGVKVWGDTAVVAKHMGFAIYPLHSQQKDVLVPAPEMDRKES